MLVRANRIASIGGQSETQLSNNVGKVTMRELHVAHFEAGPSFELEEQWRYHLCASWLIASKKPQCGEVRKLCEDSISVSPPVKKYSMIHFEVVVTGAVVIRKTTPQGPVC